MSKIEICHIKSAYGKKQVLTDVSLEVQAGACAGLVGANGCGKSTLLSIMAGVRRPDSGSVRYDGVAVTDKRNQKLFGRYVGYVPQENALLMELSVWDNLRLWYVDKARLLKELEEGFLGVLGLQEMCREKAGSLSGGMKKRVSIGCALHSNPSILILDEPGASLDLPGKAEVVKYLKLYRQMGGTVVLATHDEGELAMCDKLYTLIHGSSLEIDVHTRGEELHKILLQTH